MCLICVSNLNFKSTVKINYDSLKYVLILLKKSFKNIHDLIWNCKGIMYYKIVSASIYPLKYFSQTSLLPEVIFYLKTISFNLEF